MCVQMSVTHPHAQVRNVRPYSVYAYPSSPSAVLDIVMAYIVMAYIVRAYMVMAYIVMAYVVMAYIDMHMYLWPV